MALTVYNYLTRRREEFKPIHEGLVGIYVCGPTIYDHAHIGHAKVYISFDTIVRYFRYLGYQVRYVQNITDVGHLSDDADEGEDKILRRAARDRIEPMELVETYMRSYFEDMDALNVVRPNISPRPSCHILEQIQLAEMLLEKGHAYEVNGSVYFDVSSWLEYGKLSGRKVEEQEEGARVAVNPDKRNPAAPALTTALALDVPLVYARKTKPVTMTDPVYVEAAPSHTKGMSVFLMCSPEFLGPGDRILIIDDFLASGQTIGALVRLVRHAGAELVGVGALIEKAFEGGRKELESLGVPLHALVVISEMSSDEAGPRIVFEG